MFLVCSPLTRAGVWHYELFALVRKTFIPHKENYIIISETTWVAYCSFLFELVIIYPAYWSHTFQLGERQDWN